MPFPNYWPTDDKFMSLHNFLLPQGVNKQGVTEANAVRTLSALPGIQSFLLNKYSAQSSYEVAELQNMFMWTQIATQISHTPPHAAGYKQDKYLPARAIKGTNPGPGQTVAKNIKELFGGKRMDVLPGDWGALLILVCKNQERWDKFEQCRQNFDSSGVDATTDFNAFPWAVGAPSHNFPVIDAKRGECWLWSGQALDILHGVMTRGFQRIHCEGTGSTGYGALGRGNYFTDKFSKALLYGMNLRNEYFGAAKGSDIRVLMLSRVLLGNYLSMDNASAQERTAQRTAHNLELTGSAQQHRLNTGTYANSVALIRDQKLARAPIKKGWKNNYKITGTDRDAHIGHESVHMTHKGSNEFLVAIGKQVYPEFLVFVGKT
jgi:Poly(ADP-ribose) polymerase catalytic domain